MKFNQLLRCKIGFGKKFYNIVSSGSASRCRFIIKFEFFTREASDNMEMEARWIVFQEMEFVFVHN